jgi:hypothetical protein
MNLYRLLLWLLTENLRLRKEVRHLKAADQDLALWL